MWEVASTTAALGDTFSDIGTVLVYAIPVILTAAAALIGLGYGWRKLKSKVTGKAF